MWLRVGYVFFVCTQAQTIGMTDGNASAGLPGAGEAAESPCKFVNVTGNLDSVRSHNENNDDRKAPNDPEQEYQSSEAEEGELAPEPSETCDSFRESNAELLCTEQQEHCDGGRSVYRDLCLSMSPQSAADDISEGEIVIDLEESAVRTDNVDARTVPQQSDLDHSPIWTVESDTIDVVDHKDLEHSQSSVERSVILSDSGRQQEGVIDSRHILGAHHALKPSPSCGGGSAVAFVSQLVDGLIPKESARKRPRRPSDSIRGSAPACLQSSAVHDPSGSVALSAVASVSPSDMLDQAGQFSNCKQASEKMSRDGTSVLDHEPCVPKPESTASVSATNENVNVSSSRSSSSIDIDTQRERLHSSACSENVSAAQKNSDSSGKTSNILQKQAIANFKRNSSPKCRSDGDDDREFCETDAAAPASNLRGAADTEYNEQYDRNDQNNFRENPDRRLRNRAEDRVEGVEASDPRNSRNILHSRADVAKEAEEARSIPDQESKTNVGDATQAACKMEQNLRVLSEKSNNSERDSDLGNRPRNEIGTTTDPESDVHIENGTTQTEHNRSSDASAEEQCDILWSSALKRATACLPIRSTGAYVAGFCDLKESCRYRKEVVKRPSMVHNNSGDDNEFLESVDVDTDRGASAKSRDAIMVARAIEAAISHEHQRRCDVSAPRCNRVVLVVTSPSVASISDHELRMTNFFASSSGLSVRVMSLADTQDRNAWKCQLARRDIVLILRGSELLYALRSDFLSLARCHLIVYVGAEDALAECDPFRVLLRESYRSLPRSLQPRLLALTLVPIKDTVERVALEQSLYVEFYSGMPGEDAVFRERILPAHRSRSAPLADTETLFYASEDLLGASKQGLESSKSEGPLRSIPVDCRPIKEQPTHSSTRQVKPHGQTSVLSEVGPLGVALVQRKILQRKLCRKWSREMKASFADVNEIDPCSNCAEFAMPLDSSFMSKMMLGLCGKTISLLNLLHNWFASSRVHRDSSASSNKQFSAIIHAGSPAVAAALREVIATFPGFTGVVVRVVMGYDRTLRAFDNREDCSDADYQGEDTDDEGISEFAARIANVLIVASKNIGQISRSRRPLPPCPLVIRFDGSVVDPEVDGGGGRCRVVTFSPDSILFAKRGGVHRSSTEADVKGQAVQAQDDRRQNRFENASAFLANPGDARIVHRDHARHDRSNMRSYELANAGFASDVPMTRRQSLEDRQEYAVCEDRSSEAHSIPRFSRHRNSSNVGFSGTFSSLSNGFRSSSHFDPAVHHRDGTYFRELEGDNSSFIFRIRPPPALRGPSDEGGKSYFVYSIITQVRKGGSWVDVSAGRSDGDVHSFLLVLAARLHQRDLTVEPFQSGAESSFCKRSSHGRLRLCHVDTVALTASQVSLARQYTASVFSVVMKRCDEQMFQWGSRAVTEGNVTKRYVILPAKIRIIDSMVTPGPKRSLDDRNVAFQYYFGREMPDEVATRSREQQCGGIADCSDDDSGAQVCSIDWEKAREVVDLLKSGQRAEKYVEVERPALTERSASNLDEFSHLQGKIVYPAYCGRKRPSLAGLLDYSLCPLSKFVRQKRFALDESGCLVDREKALEILMLDRVEMPGECDSSRSVHCDATKAGFCPERVMSSCTKDSPFSEKLPLGIASTASEEDGEVTNAVVGNNAPGVRAQLPQQDGKHLDLDNVQHSRAHQPSEKSVCGDWEVTADADNVHHIGLATDSKLAQLFSTVRNRKKRRTSWFGPVRESYLTFFETVAKFRQLRLDQPMIPVRAPEQLSCEDMFRIALGSSFQSVIGDSRHSNSGPFLENKIYMLPEALCVHPVPVCSMFLPSVLMAVEQHIMTCSLRDIFIDRLDLQIDIPSLLQATTSSAVNPACNYERLEFLGDTILKLASTTRLFVSYPHKAEGELHTLRSAIVSNSALQAKAQSLGVHHFLNFSLETTASWSPPGWDSDSKPQPVHDKALADVIEAIAGVCFLRGSAEYALAGEKCPSLDSGEQCTETHYATAESEMTTKSIIQGYKAGSRFLQIITVFEDDEPTPHDILLSAIHAMHAPGSKPPEDTRSSSFPPDRRLTNPCKSWDNHLGIVENRIGYRFKRRQLLLCALTHASYAEAVGPDGYPLMSSAESFQRLEFLGDAALDFCVSCYLFDRYPNLGPGDLTDLKSAVVSNEAFARISVRKGLDRFLYCKSGSLRKEVDRFVQLCAEEDKSTADGVAAEDKIWLHEREAPKVLGDIFEAIAGAVLVDSGLEMVWNVFMKLMEDTLRERADPSRFAMHPVKLFHDYITKKENICKAGPQYVVPDHFPRKHLVKADVYVHKIRVGSGEGSTKKRAMCLAAKQAHERLSNCKPGSEDQKLLDKLRVKGDRERAAFVQSRRKRSINGDFVAPHD